MGDILFKIPEPICDLIGIEQCDEYIKQYIVSNKHSLFVPWVELFDSFDQPDNKPVNAIISDNGETFVDVDDLIDCLDEQEQQDLAEMVKILVTYHNAKMDKTDITIVA